MKKFIALQLVIALAIGGLSLTGCRVVATVGNAALSGKAKAAAPAAAEKAAPAEEKAEEEKAE